MEARDTKGNKRKRPAPTQKAAVGKKKGGGKVLDVDKPPQKKGKNAESQPEDLRHKANSEVSAILRLGDDDMDASNDSESEGDYVEGIEDEEDNEDGIGYAVNGVEGDEEEEEEHPRGGEPQKQEARREKTVRPYAPPTHKELMMIRDTEELFKSNLFRMQISELLEEVRVKYDKTVVIQSLTHKLHSVIESAPKKEFLGKTKGIDCASHIPIHPEEIKKLRFTFTPPDDINVIGSYLLRTQAKPILNIDVGIELPKAYIRQKDVINHRYSFKRAVYLHFLAEHIRKDAHFAETSWTYFRDDLHKPVLTIKPKNLPGGEYENVKTSFVINVIPILPAPTFKLTKLMPSKSNLHSHQEEHNKGESDGGVPTPAYNCRILEDIYFRQHQELLHTNLKLAPSLVDAIVLLKVWLQRRATTCQADGMNGFQISMLLVYLMQQHKITKQMSSYQIFRVALDFIVKTDLPSVGLALSSSDEEEEEETPQGAEHLEKFKAAYEVVFLDGSGMVNLTSRMSKDAYSEVRREAALCLEYFNSPVVDGFDAVFISQVNTWLKYDTYLHITLPSQPNNKEAASKPEEKEAILDGSWNALMRKKIFNVLQLGLRERTRFMRAIPASSGSTDSVFSIGIALNPETAGRLVDLGPPADHEEANEFRQLWGSKAEIRRFRDGKINEAVVWTAGDDERHLIIKQIALHLLKRFWDISESSVNYVSAQFDPLLSSKGKEKITNTNADITNTYSDLCSNIRGLVPKYVPLTVVGFHSLSPAFRGTDVYPPQPHPLAGATGKHDEHLPLCVEPLSFLVQFENSSAWPDDLQAIQKLKSAFYIKIAQGLAAKYKMNCTPTPEFVDIQYHGYVFRLAIHQLREATLLERTAPGQLAKTQKFNPAKFALTVVDRSMHSTTIHGFGQRFSSYGATVRLAKKWLDSHMFSGHVRDEAIELMVAHLYTDPSPFLPPNSHLVGFLRFLHLLSTFKWQDQPLIVDIDNELSSNDRESTLKTFERLRAREKRRKEEHEANLAKKEEGGEAPDEAQLGLLPIFITTPIDKFSKWTRGTPNPFIWERIVSYASRSLQAVLPFVENPEQGNWKLIFRTPIKKHYDALIHLISPTKALEQFGLAAPLRYKNLQVENDRGLFVGLSFAEKYVNELRENFGDIALFFYNKTAGDVVAVVWKPEAYQVKSFNVLNAYCAMPAATETKEKKKKQPANKVTLNGLDVLEQFKALGTGIVQKIEIENPNYPGKNNN